MKKQKKRVITGIKIKELFMLNFRNLIAIVIVLALSIILHNVIYRFFSIEWNIFYIIASVIVPVYFLICIVYTLFLFFRFLAKEKKIKMIKITKKDLERFKKSKNRTNRK